MDKDGKIVGIVGVANDISERKRAEAARRESEERLRLALDAAHMGTFDWDVPGNRITWSRCHEELWGFKPGEFGGTYEALAERVHPDDLPGLNTEVARCIAAREPFAREYRVVWPDGSVHWVRGRGEFAFDDDGQPVRMRGVVVETTAHKLAEEALRQSEERYRELFENAKDAIYTHDLSGRYTSFNRAAEDLTGYSREEILGKHFSNFVAPGNLKDVRENLCKKLDEVRETVYEIDLITRDRRRVPVEVDSRLIYENGIPIGVQGTARDISERKRAQEALRTYSQRLMEVQEAERHNIARELHDQIGQSLTAVRINLQSIQRSYGTADGVPSLAESIGIVDEALGRVRELSSELRPSLLDALGLNAALRWYVDRYAQRTGIIAEVLNGFEGDSRLPRELETACFEIAQEALTNVARHAQAVSVSVQLERSRERVVLTIIDDGVGFDLDELRKNASAASALGLRGMEERALAAGGYIEIDSGSGQGTRVRATFPFKRTK